MHRPKTLDEALAYLGRTAESWRPFAGGTDLMVLLYEGKLAPDKRNECRFLDISGMGELRGINADPDFLRIGALTTYAELLGDERLVSSYPNLAAAARLTGARAIQTRGTIGGNIVNASPAADAVPALISYNASIEIVSENGGSRIVPLHRFFKGYRQVDLAPGELVQAVLIPRLKGKESHLFRKVGTRRAQAIAKVAVAGLMTVQDGAVAEIRLAIGAVAPTVILAEQTSRWLLKQKLATIGLRELAGKIAQDISPIDDIRSTASYRQDVTVQVLHHWLLKGS